jgi:hypothetical protein
MARFGLLMLNKGKWDNNVILNKDYFNHAKTTSQNINLRYRYFWDKLKIELLFTTIAM